MARRVTRPRATVGMAFQKTPGGGLFCWNGAPIPRRLICRWKSAHQRSSRAEQEAQRPHLLDPVGNGRVSGQRSPRACGGQPPAGIPNVRPLVHKPEALPDRTLRRARRLHRAGPVAGPLPKSSEEEPFTRVLITTTCAKSIFLADHGVRSWSGRPARTQYVLDVPQTGPRDLDHLHTEAAEMLATAPTRSRSPKAAPRRR